MFVTYDQTRACMCVSVCVFECERAQLYARYISRNHTNEIIGWC